jgi:hypothetical protein
MEMDKSYWQQAKIVKDKQDFVQRVVRINNAQERQDFIADYGLDNFNSTLKTLSGEDHQKVIGRFRSLEMFGK